MMYIVADPGGGGGGGGGGETQYFSDKVMYSLNSGPHLASRDPSHVLT